MALERRQDVRNLAIIAHVDHGKSTVVDSLLWQSEALLEGRSVSDLPILFDPSREKRVAVVPKLSSIQYRNARVQILDLPGHANFGTEVERTLRVVDGFLLVVDACEGPLPQNRYVVRRALEAGLAPIIVLNKIDRPTADPERVLHEIRDLFVDLDASERQQQFAVVYCNALRGCASTTPGDPGTTMVPLFETILDHVPAPTHDPAAPFRLQVTQVEYDDFLGRLAVGRVRSGSLRAGAEVVHVRDGDDARTLRPSGLFGWRGTTRVEIARADRGDLVAIPGVDRVRVGDTLADPSAPDPLPALPAEESTLAIEVSVNDSPTAGQDGTHASAEQLRERLWRELLTNPSIQIEDTGALGSFRICGRSELQLAILFEVIRREGYELLAGRPSVLTRTVDGEVLEPVEILVIDCPEVFAQVVGQKVEGRGGRVVRMVNHGRGRVRVEYRIPSAGLVGFRSEFLADTRRTGILNHTFEGYLAGRGSAPSRTNGVLIADRPGRATARAIEHLQSRGSMFVAPGEAVYEGMIVGENSRANDIAVDVTKEMRTGSGTRQGAEPTARLIPPRSLSLEQALEFLHDDEVVEVTPRALRLRKRILHAPDAAGPGANR